MNDEPPTYPTPTASEMPCEGTVRFARKAFEGGHISFQDACAIAGRDIQKPQGKLPAVAYPTPRVNSLCGGAMTSTHGQLNPDWVEWLMGWPVGWTDADLDEPRDWLPLPDDPADLPPSDPGYIPRVTTRRENRASRIKALGNGQVPLCAAVAAESGFAFLESIFRANPGAK